MYLHVHVSFSPKPLLWCRAGYRASSAQLDYELKLTRLVREP
jgi:hypothetical protein